MRTVLLLAFTLFLSPVSAEELVARVRAIYYEAAGGVLVEPGMARRASSARWVDVELEDGSRALVQLPSDLQARVGDVVAVRLAAPKALGTVAGMSEPIRVSRVTRVKGPQTQLALPLR